MADSDPAETARIKGLTDELNASIKHLESVLAPLLENDIEQFAAKLPALERAKWYSLIAYAVNTLIFGCQKLDGLDPQNLPVYTELQRVKQYFEKIKKAEDAGQPQAKPNATLDKKAAGRIIKHGLAGNDKIDENRAKEQEKRKVNAHIRFDEGSDSKSKKRSAPVDESQGSEETSINAEDTTMKDAPAAPPSEHPTFPADSKVKHKHKKGSKKDRSRHKSSNPPRSSKAIFEDLLNRGSTNDSKNPE